jgi:hypothetical protein
MADGDEAEPRSLAELPHMSLCRNLHRRMGFSDTIFSGPVYWKESITFYKGDVNKLKDEVRVTAHGGVSGRAQGGRPQGTGYRPQEPLSGEGEGTGEGGQGGVGCVRCGSVVGEGKPQCRS